MAVKIRLTRMGAKKAPFYRITVADSINARDGRFIEHLGYYDPSTVPATVKLDTAKAAEWVSKGAQPTETVKDILVKQGITFAAPAEKKPRVRKPVEKKTLKPKKKKVKEAPKAE